MKVLILAAGYGTRLYPYTKNFPKPLLKVGQKPIIEYLLDKVEELKGVSSVVIVTNDRFFKTFLKWKKGFKSRYPIKILNDLTMSPKDKLGAIGDMNFVFQKYGFRGNFLVLGGDNLFRESLIKFMNFAKKKSPYSSIGLFDIKDKAEASNFGVVSLNSQKRIKEFYEKPAKPRTALVAMCLYYFPERAMRLIKKYLSQRQNCSDASGNFISWLSKQDKVYGFTFNDLWFDIGRLKTYKKAGRVLSERR